MLPTNAPAAASASSGTGAKTTAPQSGRQSSSTAAKSSSSSSKKGASAEGKSSQDQDQPVPVTVRKDELIKALLKKLTPYFAIVAANGKRDCLSKTAVFVLLPRLQPAISVLNALDGYFLCSYCIPFFLVLCSLVSLITSTAATRFCNATIILSLCATGQAHISSGQVPSVVISTENRRGNKVSRKRLMSD
jgi:hypothetical protein